MKLTHPDVHFDIEFGKADSLIPVCVVESPVRWREIQKELISQQSGDSGNWVSVSYTHLTLPTTSLV